jgi:hypothetical protein
VIVTKFKEAKVIKKQVILIGIVALLVCIGFSGCIQTTQKSNNNSSTNNSLINNNNQSSNINYIKISELKMHPTQYYGKTITIKAIFEFYEDCHNPHPINYFVISDTDVNCTDNGIGLEIPNEVNTSLLMLGETYYFTGYLSNGNHTGFDFYTEKPVTGLYFRVSSIELFVKSESNTPTLKEIGNNPPSYFFKTITIKGQISKDLSQIEYKISIPNCSSYKYTININTQNVDSSVLKPGQEYYFTGIITLNNRFNPIPCYKNTNWWTLCPSSDKNIYGLTFISSEIKPT